MTKNKPTVKEHYIPQFYLKNFSFDKKNIYQFDISEGKQIENPVLIRKICFEKNLYEFKNEKGEFENRNLIEKNLSMYEAIINDNIKKIRNKSNSETSYQSASFLSKEEKAFLIFFIIIQSLRVPGVIEMVQNEISKSCRKDINENILRNTALNLCLPVYKNLDIKEYNLVNYLFPYFENMAFLIGKSTGDHIYTSDNPLALLFDDDERLVKVIFPLSTDLALIMKPIDEIPRQARNRLIKLSHGDVKFINKTIIRTCNRWIYTMEPIAKKQIKWIIRERKKADELFQHRSLHN